MAEELLYWPLERLLRAYRTRKVSPRELLAARIRQIEARNPALNALVNLEFETAREAAREAERRYRDGTARPLEGLTLAVKEAHAFAGRETTQGSNALAGHRDRVSAVTVKRLLDAGAIPLGRSTTPEFMLSFTTCSARFGVTRNPWNLELSPGGSSGGAAAALAAGMVCLADGSDHGGSIRQPAACCGIVGYKPPRGRNPVRPDRLADPFLHYGPLGRFVGDVVLAQNVMAGPHPADPASLPAVRALSPRARPLTGWRIALTVDLGFFDVARDVADAIRVAAEILRRLGAEIGEPTGPVRAHHLEAYRNACRALLPFRLGPIVRTHARGIEPSTRSYIESGLDRKGRLALDAQTYLDSLRARDALAADFAALFAKYDLLVSATTATPWLPASPTPPEFPLHIGRASYESEDHWQLTWPFNMAARHPAIVIPARPGHPPIGLQIVAAACEDWKAIAAAAAYQRANPWLGPNDRPVAPSRC